MSTLLTKKITIDLPMAAPSGWGTSSIPMCRAQALSKSTENQTKPSTMPRTTLSAIAM
jgi:hypothetical protein